MRSSTLTSFFCVLFTAAYFLVPAIKKGINIHDCFHDILIIVTIQALFGIIRYGDFISDSSIENAYCTLLKIRTVSILPLLTYHVGAQYGLEKYFLQAILITWCILIVKQFTSIFEEELKELPRIILLVQAGGLLFMSYEVQNYYGLNAGVTYLFATFIVTEEYTYMDMPAIDLNNYLTCFYVFFAYKTCYV